MMHMTIREHPHYCPSNLTNWRRSVLPLRVREESLIIVKLRKEEIE
jgi:hypothetical protein